MRKIKVKKLRKDFENSSFFILLNESDRLRNSDMYKTKWRLFKKVHKNE